MTDRQALIGLNLIPEISGARLKNLLGFLGRPASVFKSGPAAIRQACGIPEAVCRKILCVRVADIDRQESLAGKQGARIVTWDEPDYPASLKDIYDPPPVLYIKGSIGAQDCLCLAVVGSRRASIYGINQASKFASGLAECGFVIVSGLARGVDASAHRGALKAGGRTIAVIGSGLDRVYPPEHKELAVQIADNGAVISEFAFGEPPLAKNFPRRNRIISGLSLGVLVVEAASNSGALITADFALEQGKDVFALPACLDSPNASGTNQLIKDGAKLVTCVWELVEEYAGKLSLPHRPLKTPQMPASGLIGDRRERLVYEAINDDRIHIDELREKTSMDIPEISAILLKLSLAGLVRQLPGKYISQK